MCIYCIPSGPNVTCMSLKKKKIFFSTKFPQKFLFPFISCPLLVVLVIYLNDKNPTFICLCGLSIVVIQFCEGRNNLLHFFPLFFICGYKFVSINLDFSFPRCCQDLFHRYTNHFDIVFILEIRFCYCLPSAFY